MPLSFKAEKLANLEKGSYSGVMRRLEFKETTSRKTGETYAYLDIFVEVNGIEKKVGIPAKLNKKTTLGKLVNQFTPVIEGENYDLEEILVGKRVRFDVYINENGYSEINPESMVKE